MTATEQSSQHCECASCGALCECTTCECEDCTCANCSHEGTETGTGS